jgi:DNA-binding NtrC family response regulator
MARILLIDDDGDLCHLIQITLQEHGHAVHCLERAEGGPDLVAAGGFDVVLVDQKMPGMSGIEFMEALRRRGVRVPVVFMTGHGSPDLVIEAYKLRAVAYVTKALDIDRLSDELLAGINKALKTSRVINDPVAMPAETGPDDGEAVMLGTSEGMMEVYKLIGDFADSPDPVLVLGETGTGKELVARALHQHSSRSAGPFVALNTAAIPESTLQSELFGHEKGAFTGADQRYAGKFEQANGGTILLDEIGDMNLAAQAKILRVLQDRKITRMGGSQEVPVDFRVIASTHRDLEAMFREGAFRRDLYYRLNGVTIRLPPLRERVRDVEQLAQHFAAQEAKRLGGPSPRLHESALELLRRYEWPGNVRELQKVARRAVRACRGPQVLAEDLGLSAAPENGSGPQAAVIGLRQAVRWALASDEKKLYSLLEEMLMRELIQAALTEHDGNQTQVAERLGVARGTVIDRVKKYGLR